MDDRCVMRMTPSEIASANVLKAAPAKCLVIVDTGSGWEVTEYSPDAAGLGTEHVTIQSAIEASEVILAKMRRSETPIVTDGVVISDPDDVAEALA